MNPTLDALETKLNELYKQYDVAQKAKNKEDQRNVLLDVAQTYTAMAKSSRTAEQVNQYREKANDARNHFLKLLEISKETYQTVKKDNVNAKNGIMFDDVVGLDDVKKEIQLMVIEPLLHPKYNFRFKNIIRIGGGILLHGEPGNGKTMIAKAIANECQADFFKSVRLNEILSKYYGESEKYIASLFEEARKHKFSILFFDEFDAIAQTRSETDQARVDNKLVNQLLSELDAKKQDSDKTMLIIAATNRIGSIDPSIQRSGRFDKKFYIPLPDEKARHNMLKKTLDKVPYQAIDIAYYSKKTEKYSYADLENLVQEACKLSRHRAISKKIPIDEVYLSESDLEEAFNNVNQSKKVSKGGGILESN